MDQPLTIRELARIVESRKRYKSGTKSIHQKIQFWIDKGFYGIKMFAWRGPTSHMTTLRNYLTFRRQVAQERKKCAKKLMRRIQKIRYEDRKAYALPFPSSYHLFVAHQNLAVFQQ